MKKSNLVVILLAAFVFMTGCSHYSGVTSASKNVETKTTDVNNDGKPDVTYYGEEGLVTKVEADTNYDGKPDVVVTVKNGKFESAEADTDYNGSRETKFTDQASFNKWVNDTHPAFNDKLNKRDWQFNLLKF